MKKRGKIFSALQNIEQESPRKIKAKEKSLRTSLNEAAAASGSVNTGDKYLVPFALAINAQPIHIGILSSLSGLITPFSQIFGNKLMEKRSRKSIVLKFVFLQSIMWLSLALISYLYFKGIFQQYLIYSLIVAYLLVVIIGGIAFPAWFSWMGDLVPPNKRGDYFSKRNRVMGVVGIAIALIAALILDAFKTKGIALIGFITIFIAASTFRFISCYFFRKQFSPKFKLKKGDYFSIRAFLKRNDNFGKFAIYQGAFYFAMMIASPFFAVYMLKELKFSYVTFTIVTLSMSVFYLLFQPLAGKFSDKYGNRKLLVIANILFPIVPILWIFFKSPIFIILFPQIVSGAANSAYIIAHTNFVYDSVSPRHRGICITYTNILSGIGIFFGSLLGGFLLSNFPQTVLSSFFVIFGLSALLRLLSAIFFLPKIQEERQNVQKIPPMHLNLAHPFKTINHEIGWFRTIFS